MELSPFRYCCVPRPALSRSLPLRERSEWWGGWLRVSVSERGAGWGVSQRARCAERPPPRPPLCSGRPPHTGQAIAYDECPERSRFFGIVMAGLVAAIHVLRAGTT